MGIFNFLDKLVSKTFDNLSNEAVDGITNMAKNAKLPPHAIKLMKDIEDRGEELRKISKEIGLDNDYVSKSYKMEGIIVSRKGVNNRFNELSSLFQNGILYSDKVFYGIDSLGELTSEFLTKDNERFSGMVYFIKKDLKFKVNELTWLRNFNNGIVNGISEKYSFNKLVERVFYDNGTIKKIDTFDKSKDIVVGTLLSTTEFVSNHEFTKTIYDSSGNYKVELYKDNKPHGDWLSYKTFGIHDKTTYLFSRERYNEGLENGKWEWYNKDGIITFTQYWKDGSDSFLKDEIEKFNVGISYNSIIEILGEPDFIKNTISNGKSRRKIYYGKSINRLGNDAYAFEISFVDDKLFGFKELGQVGINNK